MIRLLLLLPMLLVPLSANAEDPCAGRNPLYCRPVKEPAPIICGYERVKPEGSIATTHDFICRQNGVVISVRLGKDNNWNINDVKTRNY